MADNEMFRSAGQEISLADEEGVKDVLVGSVLGLWEIVNNLTRLRPSKSDRYRVTIFGSSRSQPGTEVYDEVKRVAGALTGLGCDIITGGGPGLMQAANEGSSEADALDRNRSVGIRVELPFEQATNPFVEQVFEHKTFFTRLHHFVLVSDAFIVAPGGIGTVLETMMIWQLLQVRQIHNTPLILVGTMWKDLVNWTSKHMLSFQPPMVNPDDLEIPICVESADEAIALVAKHHTEWKLRSEDA